MMGQGGLTYSRAPAEIFSFLEGYSSTGIRKCSYVHPGTLWEELREVDQLIIKKLFSIDYAL